MPKVLLEPRGFFQQVVRKYVQIRDHGYGIHGHYDLACCPVHGDSHPSLAIWHSGHWKCFACDRGGLGSVSFLAFVEGISELEAAAKLQTMLPDSPLDGLVQAALFPSAPQETPRKQWGGVARVRLSWAEVSARLREAGILGGGDAA